MPEGFKVGDFVWVLASRVIAAFAAASVLLAATGADTPTSSQTFVVLLPAELVGAVLALAWVRSRRGYAGFEDAFGFTVRLADLRYLGLGVLINVALIGLFLPVASALGIEENPQQVVRIVEELSGFGLILAAAVVTVVLGPVVEELTYRGLLLRLVAQRSSNLAAMVVSSAAFALIHLLGINAFDRDTLLAVVAVAIPQFFILGMVMARLTIRSGGLSQAIMTHAGFNLLTFLALVAAPSLVQGV